MQYCESLPRGLNYVPYAMWLPLNLAGGCASCIAKESLLTVTPEDLLVGNMVKADVTVQAVRRAMCETETIRVPEALEKYQKRLPGQQPLMGAPCFVFRAFCCVFMFFVVFRAFLFFVLFVLCFVFFVFCVSCFFVRVSC